MGLYKFPLETKILFNLKKNEFNLKIFFINIFS
jgi:hypothetical protein